MNPAKEISQFLADPPDGVSYITNEQALQVELGIFFRSLGYNVSFEKRIIAERLDTSVKSPKSRVDIVLELNDEVTCIELKTPLNGRHPESLFDFCKDIEFIESIIRHKMASNGLCVLLSNDHNFWTDTGRGSCIHNAFRLPDGKISGKIVKPTGKKDAYIFIENEYHPFNLWNDKVSGRILKNGRFLIIEVNNEY